MNTEVLKNAVDRERDQDDLNDIGAEFYERAHDHLRELRHAVEDADNAGEASEIHDEYKLAESKLKGLIDRRQAKLIEAASLTSSGYVVEPEGTTEGEQCLLDGLVGELTAHREAIIPEFEDDND